MTFILYFLVYSYVVVCKPLQYLAVATYQRPSFHLRECSETVWRPDFALPQTL